MYQDKLNHLNAVRSDIGEEQYRRCAAIILTSHYANVMKDRSGSEGVSKAILYSVVNLHLTNLGCREVSYGFIRRVDRVG